jgi:hypothetical protein
MNWEMVGLIGGAVAVKARRATLVAATEGVIVAIGRAGTETVYWYILYSNFKLPLFSFPNIFPAVICSSACALPLYSAITPLPDTEPPVQTSPPAKLTSFGSDALPKFLKTIE